MIQIRAGVRRVDPCVNAAKADAGGPGGFLGVGFGEPEENLAPMEWEFFEIFDENELEFLCQHKAADGKPSRFNEFISKSD